MFSNEKITCKAHNAKAALYCNTDHTHICIDCLPKHSGHDIENTEDAARDFHKLLQAQFEPYKSLLLQVKKFNADDKRTRLAELIKSAYGRLADRLDALAKQRLDDLDEAEFGGPSKEQLLAYDELQRECLT